MKKSQAEAILAYLDNGGEDLRGRTFGRLTVNEFLGKIFRTKGTGYMWLCVCSCGKERKVLGGNLRSGHTVSCGCYHREQTGISHTTHGHYKNRIATATYRTWSNMKSRCTRQKDKSWKHYGGRGIKVCRRWYKFENFLTDMGEKPAGMSIERINNNGNYEPSNCKWATWSENCSNRRPYSEARKQQCRRNLAIGRKIRWDKYRAARKLVKSGEQLRLIA